MGNHSSLDLWIKSYRFKMKSLVVLLVALTALSDGQQMNMNMNNECLKSYMGKDSPMDPMMEIDRLPGCLKTIRFSKEARKITMDCMKEANAEAIMMEVMEEKTEANMKKMEDVYKQVMKCKMTKLEVLDKDDKINFEKLNEVFDTHLMGDSREINVFKENHDICRKTIDTEKLSGVDLCMAMSDCVMKECLNFCIETGRDPGKLPTMLALSSMKKQREMKKEDRCAPVKILSKMAPPMMCTLSTVMKSGKFAKEITSKFNRDEDKKKNPSMMMTIMSRLARSLGIMHNETGLNFEVLKILIQDLPGWEDIPDELTEVLNSIDACGRQSPFNQDTPAEIARMFPWKAAPSPQFVQRYKFIQCLLPRMTEICGIRNQLSLFLFPHIAHLVPKTVVDEIMGEDYDEFRSRIMEMVSKHRMDDDDML